MPSWWLRQEEREVGLYMEADILDVLSGFHRNSAEGLCACVGALITNLDRSRRYKTSAAALEIVTSERKAASQCQLVSVRYTRVQKFQ